MDTHRTLWGVSAALAAVLLGGFLLYTYMRTSGRVLPRAATPERPATEEQKLQVLERLSASSSPAQGDGQRIKLLQSLQAH